MLHPSFIASAILLLMNIFGANIPWVIVIAPIAIAFVATAIFSVFYVFIMSRTKP